MTLDVGNFEKFTILSDAGQPHSRVAASARLRLRTHRHAMTCHLRSKVVQLGSPSIFCVATWASSSKTLSIARPTGVSACADDYQVKTKINHLPAMLQTYRSPESFSCSDLYFLLSLIRIKQVVLLNGQLFRNCQVYKPSWAVGRPLCANCQFHVWVDGSKNILLIWRVLSPRRSNTHLKSTLGSWPVPVEFPIHPPDQTFAPPQRLRDTTATSAQNS